MEFKLNADEKRLMDESFQHVKTLIDQIKL